MQNDPNDDQQQGISETEEFWIRVTLYKLVYAVSGLIIGLSCIAAGLILILNSLTSSTIETVSRGELISAVPWAVLFVIGIFIMIVTRYSRLSAKQEYDMVSKEFAPRLSISHRVSQEVVSNRFWRTMNTYALVYSVCGLTSGAGLIIGGIVLSLRLIMDDAGWAEHIVDGILGITLFSVGLFVIIITRYSVKSLNRQDVHRGHGGRFSG